MSYQQHEKKALMLQYFRVGTFLLSAPAVDAKPDHIDTGKSDPEYLLAWYTDISSKMENDDLNNLFLSFMHNETIPLHEQKRLSGNLRGFWKRMMPNKDYYLQVAERVREKAA